MTRLTHQVVVALAAALALPIALSGCSGPSDGEVQTTLENRVVESIPHATGALVSLSYSGPTSRGVFVRVYLDDASLDVVTTAIDKAFKLAWTTSPTEPAQIGVGIVDGAKPHDASSVDRDGMDLTEAGAAIGVDAGSIGTDQVILFRLELVDRYGAWRKPADR